MATMTHRGTQLQSCGPEATLALCHFGLFNRGPNEDRKKGKKEGRERGVEGKREMRGLRREGKKERKKGGRNGKRSRKWERGKEGWEMPVKS